jgi:hypothetical protein
MQKIHPKCRSDDLRRLRFVTKKRDANQNTTPNLRKLGVVFC